MKKWRERIFINVKLGMRVCIKRVMIKVLEEKTSPYQKNLDVKSKIFPHRNILVIKDNEMQNFSDLFDKVLYMFRTGPLSIIRITSTLFTRNRYLSC